MSRDQLRRGDVFEGRVIQDVLGEGASGVVYRAYEPYTQREVALKVIQNTLGSRFEEKARNETVVQAKILHPNVTIVHAGGITAEGNQAYIVMELVDGFSLRAVLRSVEYLSVPEALRLGIQVLQGADAAHQLNIVHRDLKPENILLQASNQVKLVDFGIAKFLGAHYNTTGKFRINGTPMYMSPEQCRGEDVTPQSDIYAVGVILLEALLGRHWVYVRNPTPSRDDFVNAHLSQVPTPLTQLIYGIPPRLSDIVACAVEKKPEKRFASAQKMIEELQGCEAEVSRYCVERGMAPALRGLVALTRAQQQEPAARYEVVHAPAVRSLPAPLPKNTIPNTPDAKRALPQALASQAPVTRQPYAAAVNTVVPSQSSPLQPRIAVRASRSTGRSPESRVTRPSLWTSLENAPFSKVASVAIGLGVLVAIPIGVSTGKTLVSSRDDQRASSAPVGPSRPASIIAAASTPISSPQFIAKPHVANVDVATSAPNASAIAEPPHAAIAQPAIAQPATTQRVPATTAVVRTAPKRHTAVKVATVEPSAANRDVGEHTPPSLPAEPSAAATGQELRMIYP